MCMAPLPRDACLAAQAGSVGRVLDLPDCNHAVVVSSGDCRLNDGDARGRGPALHVQCAFWRACEGGGGRRRKEEEEEEGEVQTEIRPGGASVAGLTNRGRAHPHPPAPWLYSLSATLKHHPRLPSLLPPVSLQSSPARGPRLTNKRRRCTPAARQPLQRPPPSTSRSTSPMAGASSCPHTFLMRPSRLS